MSEIEEKYYKYIHSKVKSIEYRKDSVRYIDGFTGQHKVYSPSFTIVLLDGTTEYVEVLPASKQQPLTKYLYAQNYLGNWRMINKKELIDIGIEDNETVIIW